MSSDERGKSTKRGSFGDGYQPQFFFSTAGVTGTVNLDDKDKMIKMGDNTEFTVDLVDKVVIEKNDRFIMREGGRTVGRGVITEIIE